MSENTVTQNAPTKTDRAAELFELEEGVVMTRQEARRLYGGWIVCLALSAAGMFGDGLLVTVRIALFGVGAITLWAWFSWFKSLLPDDEEMAARRERLAAQQHEQKERQEALRVMAREKGRCLLGLAPLSGSDVERRASTVGCRTGEKS